MRSTIHKNVCKKTGQKGLKLAFLAKNSRFLADFSLTELGGTPPHPLTENQCEKKKVFFLSGIGGVPPHP